MLKRMGWAFIFLFFLFFLGVCLIESRVGMLQAHPPLFDWYLFDSDDAT